MVAEPLASEVAFLQAAALQEDTPRSIEDHDPLGESHFEPFACVHR
jgi:hypothetical protein